VQKCFYDLRATAEQPPTFEPSSFSISLQITLQKQLIAIQQEISLILNWLGVTHSCPKCSQPYNSAGLVLLRNTFLSHAYEWVQRHSGAFFACSWTKTSKRRRNHCVKRERYMKHLLSNPAFSDHSLLPSPCPCVHPQHGIVERHAGDLVPDNGRFSLVCEAQGHNLNRTMRLLSLLQEAGCTCGKLIRLIKGLVAK
jgi:hypothetical protein